ncbi:MAG: TonB-dependent receptor [Janthinobacterium lividum]
MQRACFGSRLAAALMSMAATPAIAQTGTKSTPSAATIPLASSTAQQPTAGASSTSATEQIIVTANKRRELQRNVANSVTAISGKELDRKQEVRLQDLVAQVPGLSLEVDDKTAVRIVLRGLNTGSVGATAGSVLDDVPTNTTGAQNNAATNSPNFDTYDLSRIEVLRGPQSSLYGATAEGGLIKYVTNAPDPTAYSGELEGGVDGTTAGGIGGSTKGFANIPFWAGKAAIRVSAWNEFTPGYIDNPELGKTDTNTAQQYGWRASVLVQPVPDLTVRLLAERQTLLSDNSDSIQVVGAALTPLAPPFNQLELANGLVNNKALPTRSQNESAVYYSTIDYNLHWATVTSVTSFAYNNFKSIFDASNTNLAAGLTYADYLSELVYKTPISVDERQNSNTEKFNQEVRLSSEPGLTLFGRTLNWLGGAFYTHETSALLQFLDASDASQSSRILSPAAGGLTLFGQLSTWAVFGQTDYQLLPGVDLALGGRFSGTAQHSQTANFCCVLYGSGTTLPTLSSNDHDALYTVAPRWRPNDNTMFYGRIATGYRPGGPNVEVAGVSGIPNSYAPDRTVNYEIGWRQDMFHKTVAVDLTGFYIDWKNVQVLSEVDTSAGMIGANGNAGSAVSKGIEWSLSWLPLHGLRLSTVGDYTDARLTASAAGLGAASGEFLPYVPNVSTSVNVDYNWAVFRNYSAYVSGTWSFTGERYTSFSPSTTVTVSHALLPSYSTGAIRIGLENRRYSLEAFITNLSDERGISYYANSGGADQTGQVTIIQPRTIGMSARVKF